MRHGLRAVVPGEYVAHAERWARAFCGSTAAIA